jgi:hypothetical protein
MLVKKINVKLINFFITKSNLKFNSSKNLKNTLIGDDIPVDLDFDINKIKNERRFVFKCTVKTVPQKVKVNVFDFDVETSSVVEITKAVKHDEEQLILLRMALPLIISGIRSFLSDISSYTPILKYYLPVIDLQDLLQRKFKIENNNVAKKLLAVKERNKIKHN